MVGMILKRKRTHKQKKRKRNQMDEKKREKTSLQPLQADIKNEKQVVL